MLRYLCNLLCVFVMNSCTFGRSDIVVSVYEHRAAGSPVTDSPLQLMGKNLHFYHTAARNAASLGANLILFPGMLQVRTLWTRQTLSPVRPWLNRTRFWNAFCIDVASRGRRTCFFSMNKRRSTASIRLDQYTWKDCLERFSELFT